MKKFFTTSMLAAAALLTPFFTAGAQTPISTFDELNTIVHASDFDYSGSYYLTADIVVPDGHEWVPIGAPSDWPTNTSMIEFAGVFDGKGHSIKNLKITAGVAFCGFFGKLLNKAVVKNLGLENVNITGGNPVGGLSATMYGNEADMDGSLEAVTIEKVFVTGSVKGIGHVGGIVGRCNNNPTNILSNCYSNCDVEVTEAASPDAIAGGIVGCMKSGRGLKISNCYAAGTVKKTNDAFYTGGILGGVANSNANANTTFTLENSAVVLSEIGASPSDLFFTTTAAFKGVTILSNNYARNDLGLTASWAGCAVREPSAFLDQPFYEYTLGWDFTDVWEMEDGVSYPTLKFSNTTTINNAATGKPAYTISATVGGLDVVSAKSLSLKIYDMTGRTLAVKQVSGYARIPAPKGLYLVQASCGNSVNVQKMTVK
ncbi:MAG: hypothetical protein LBR34_08980 [Prevotella sp.]|jgi:hypothetical protein|nr:hypothetical protein [Prevotella sp.]